MAIHLPIHSRSLDDLVRFDRNVFATKIRLVRAVLGWSQTELGLQVGLTQRAIHKLEQGETAPRRTTVRALEDIWRKQNIEFEDLADGSLRVSIRGSLLNRLGKARPQRRRVAGTPFGTTVHRTRDDSH